MIEIPNKYLNSLKDYSFIDLFAGIGGFHLAFSSFGAKCIFASEWDKEAVETYKTNFNLIPYGDITLIDEKEIPQHQILCAGFPCQSFSISGKQRGFEDTRGTLFFDIERIINFHKPNVIFLENVKHLVKHNTGKTLDTILNTLKKLDYNTNYIIFNASNFGLPQNRERVFIVAFHKQLNSSNFIFPIPPNHKIALKDILEINESLKEIVRDDIMYSPKKQESTQTLFNDTFNKPIQIGKVNKGGQGERIYDINGHSITLSAYGGGVGAKTGLYLVGNKLRKLTPRECARLQGFPDDFIMNDNINQAYKQFGNSVSVNILQYIIIQIIKVLQENEQ